MRKKIHSSWSVGISLLPSLFSSSVPRCSSRENCAVDHCVTVSPATTGHVFFLYDLCSLFYFGDSLQIHFLLSFSPWMIACPTLYSICRWIKSVSSPPSVSDLISVCESSITTTEKWMKDRDLDILCPAPEQWSKYIFHVTSYYALFFILTLVR